MMPSKSEAERLLQEAELCNPGPWVRHSRITAHCAGKIAEACADLDPEKAYILGLLHDIGRRFGTGHLRHVVDGYTYMLSLGYDDVARICLTHSFHTQTIEDYVGKADISEAESECIRQLLAAVTFDDYDRLIQLCDALAGSEHILDIEARMADVKRRYGFYPQRKWDKNVELMAYFEEKTGKNLYALVGKDTYQA